MNECFGMILTNFASSLVLFTWVPPETELKITENLPPKEQIYKVILGHHLPLLYQYNLAFLANKLNYNSNNSINMQMHSKAVSKFLLLIYEAQLCNW